MMDSTYNLLTDPLIHAAPCGLKPLPGLLAALSRDQVESFPALRPHQRPAWHMFLVQLAALALHRARAGDIPTEEGEWARALRGLTPGFSNDEPWRLVVEDWAKPAFLQPPVPEGVELAKPVPTPDALDLLITSRNHDLKQAVARRAEAQDWAFALVSLQTGEGYGGAGNQGVARMNGGSSSRAMLVLAPSSAQADGAMAPRPGSWFRRDVRVLLETRAHEIDRTELYADGGGLGLTWLAPWPEGEQLQLKNLDIWFIEICRRIRLKMDGGLLRGRKGTSKATRINAKHLGGALGDPFAPVHKTDNKSFTLAGRDFDYRTLIDLVLSGDWEMPVLARPASFESEGETLLLVAEALARGNSKTEGFKSRILPIGGKVSRALSLGPKREELHKLAQAQMEEIGVFDKALRDSLVLAAVGGDREKKKEELKNKNKRDKLYALTEDARARLDRAADEIFFERLWARFGAQEKGAEALKAEKERFARALFEKARTIFEASLPAITCASVFRPRAEARARRAFEGALRKSFPELFPQSIAEETENAAA